MGSRFEHDYPDQAAELDRLARELFGAPDVRLDKLVTERAKRDGIDYRDALKLVTAERPELVRAYRAESLRRADKG